MRIGKFFIVGLLSIALGNPSANAGLPLSLFEDSEELPSLAPMLEKATPSVVNIATRNRTPVPGNPLFKDPFFRFFFNPPDSPKTIPRQSLGSGVIISAREGLVLTNNHVIDKADEITVTLRDGRQLSAKVVGTDPPSDIAVIKIPAQDLTALPMANSDTLRVGDFVIAIGNPFGLGQTVTSGIVSALGRSGLGIEGYENFIQTDASINPGNSGGALVNLRGELVGINTAIFTPDGGNVGIGFAIPSNMAREIMEQLLKYGEVHRGRLGIAVQDLTPELIKAFGIDIRQGAVVVQVLPNSAAAESELEVGDIIVAVDDQPVHNADQLRNLIGLSRAGKQINLTVLRNGKEIHLTITIKKITTTSAPGKIAPYS
ncbi:protease Do [Nitrosococcus halophilus Nc 4]|uniref:Protease Do n=1 Tax=Nitrosococcus halophilus (strain Nc4) TaxID=472759 RepID=D5C412_NITHN|nr:protease Do [Nitrosococcus halophilus Nc 4]